MPSEPEACKNAGGLLCQTAGHALKSELARFCLPSANRDSDRKLAWVNSICLFFLLIGLVGGKTAAIRIKQPPPLEEAIPAIIEPVPPPPVKIEAQDKPDDNQEAKPDVPQVVVVTPDSPAVNFSIPTIGNLVVPASLAVAPPSAPLRQLTAARTLSVSDTGRGGDRPSPPYPKLAQDLAQQGTVLLSITADENGGITAIEVKQSSGSPILDRSTLDYVKRHWILPPGVAGQIYEAPIHYVLTQ